MPLFCEALAVNQHPSCVCNTAVRVNKLFCYFSTDYSTSSDLSACLTAGHSAPMFEYKTSSV